MKNNHLKWLLAIVFLVGIFGSGFLVYEEIITKGTCPKLLGIPACFIIFACFVISFVAHIKKKDNIYFTITGIAFAIALIASIMQFTGYGECPKTSNGTPMCYYSLLIFSSLIIFKKIMLKKNKAI